MPRVAPTTLPSAASHPHVPRRHRPAQRASPPRADAANSARFLQLHVPHARRPGRPPTSTRKPLPSAGDSGELSRARQLLTAAELAPGDEATRAALTDPAKRPPQPREPIPPQVLQFQPPTPVRLTSAAVARSLREAKRGSTPGLSGARAEHYKLLLGHADDMELLTEAANLLAQAHVPCEVAAGVSLIRMTAIRKPGGGVRGFFFFSPTFLRVRTSGSLCKAAYVVRAGRQLVTGACNQRASASSSCKAGGHQQHRAQRREEAQGAKPRRLAARQHKDATPAVHPSGLNSAAHGGIATCFVGSCRARWLPRGRRFSIRLPGHTSSHFALEREWMHCQRDSVQP